MVRIRDPELGFTGSSDTLLRPQIATLKCILLDLYSEGWRRLHHGDCINADATAHNIWKGIALDAVVGIHPPTNPNKRAFCNGSLGDEIYPEKDYLARNHDIVDAAANLIGAPRGSVEELRSGTWATIRYARKVGIPRILIFPDGRVSYD